MEDPWRRERIFFTVKAYPTIGKKGEQCCTAGITEAGDWIRIYPVPFRELVKEAQFQRYTWVSARIRKSNDSREESYIIDIDSIKVEEKVPTDAGWSQRNRIVLPKCEQSLEAVKEHHTPDRHTLTLIKPKAITGFEIDQIPDDEFTKQVENLRQMEQQQSFLPRDQTQALELIPYTFRYSFTCDDERCKGHRMKIVDWEIYQAFRSWRQYPDWEKKLRQKFEIELPSLNLHLFLGTLRKYPDNWIIIGLYYPRSSAEQLQILDL